MADKKMESFKIGDTQRPTVGRATKAPAAKQQAAASEENSLGFRHIETILEQDEASNVSESLNRLLQSLEELAQKTTTNREKAAAQKAIVAVERCADLLDYLFQTKAQMKAGG